MEIIDARGKACPLPVVVTRRAMHQHDALQVLVSTRDAMNNVRQLAEKSGWSVETSEHPDGYALTLRKVGGEVPSAQPAQEREQPAAAHTSVMLITGLEFGTGIQELGELLLKNLLYTLTEIEPKPQALILLNKAVTLATQDSPVLESLLQLREQGIEILVCGTCLGYLNLRDKLVVGTVSNMYTIAEMLLRADHTITI